MNQALTLSIDLTVLAIEPIVLDNLASEYYGSVLSAAGRGEDATMTVEFSPPDAEAHRAGLQLALDSYRLRD